MDWEKLENELNVIGTKEIFRVEQDEQALTYIYTEVTENLNNCITILETNLPDFVVTATLEGTNKQLKGDAVKVGLNKK